MHLNTPPGCGVPGTAGAAMTWGARHAPVAPNAPWQANKAADPLPAPGSGSSNRNTGATSPGPALAGTRRKFPCPPAVPER